MDNSLSREATAKIEKMVERVALKAGYTGMGDKTYKEHIQAKFEQNRDKFIKKVDKYKHKLSLKPSNTDFVEEIRTYLQDGLKDLMKEGHSEEEALKITMEKFDEAELSENFNEYVKAFGGFGMEEWHQWNTPQNEAIGVFYGGFVLLGMVAGSLLGYIFGHTLINILVGLAAGLFTGAALGLISHGIIVLRKQK